MLNKHRRQFLLGAASLALLFSVETAFADGGSGSGSGGGGSGSGGGGGSGSGSGGGGSGGGGDSGGGGNSGSGGGDSGSDDGGDDDHDGDSGSGSGSGRRQTSDQDRARSAVESGKAVPLNKLKDHLKKNYPGKILRVDLVKNLGSFRYRVRLLQPGNRLKSLSLDARTLREKAF